MGDRSELTRRASLLTTGLVGTEVALLGAGASSVGAEAGAVGSPEVSASRGLGGSTVGKSCYSTYLSFLALSVGGGDRGYGGSRFESRSGGYGGSRDYYSR